MQVDVHKTLYPFYTTKEMPHVTVTITKNTSLAAIARYISITTIYTVGYLQIRLSADQHRAFLVK